MLRDRNLERVSSEISRQGIFCTDVAESTLGSSGFAWLLLHALNVMWQALRFCPTTRPWYSLVFGWITGSNPRSLLTSRLVNGPFGNQSKAPVLQLGTITFVGGVARDVLLTAYSDNIESTREKHLSQE